MRRPSRVRIFVLSAASLALVAGVTNLGSFGSGAVAQSRYNTVPVRTAGVPRGLAGPLLTRGPNVNITNKSGAQSETSIAIDPTNAKHLIANQNDLTSTLQVYESFDGGKTWANANLGLGTTFCYDPWVDFNAAGDAFAFYECSDQRVAYRKVGQTTWTKTKLTMAGGFPDRDMGIVDTTPTSPFFNSVYIGYDDNSANNAVHVLYSRDGFGGWVRSPKINDTSSSIGVNAAVAPDGTLYATWEDYSARKIFTDKSTDGGATWGTDHLVTNYRLNTTTFFISIPPQNFRGVLPMPFTRVAPEGSPCAGRLFVAYFDKDPVTADTNIYVRYSDDGGTTWSGEIRVDDDPGDGYQFFENIAIAPDGTIGMSFYDTRNDPANKKTTVSFTWSTDCGLTWAPNLRLSTAQSDETVGSFDFNQYGDYEGIDAGPAGNFASTWTDSRPSAQNEDQFSAMWKN